MGHILKLKNENVSAPLTTIANEVKNSVDAELVYESVKELNDVKTVFIVFEKYYFRNNTYSGLAVLLSEADKVQTAELVGSGGGEGFMNFSFGANKSFVNSVAAELAKYGFSEF